ncbi:alkaline-phosphatase-like protein [Thelonectria olida]|uniref:Alkaline-phosphatase-like protein n=1 Tax=Thelonectria olida TaxID=1576542 RepID=A0A9P8VX28_9HYPO|nr:alkaline-phosphatase-like protein [Thelonectria olida]
MYLPSVSLIFSVFFVSVVSAKVVHLFLLASTVPVKDFLLYFPSFFLPDFLAICIGRIVLRPVRSWFTFLCAIIGVLITSIALFAGSAQLGFSIKTGAELEWHEAREFAADEDAIKLLLTGIWGVLACGSVILVIAWFSQNFVYRVTGDFLFGIYEVLAFGPRYFINIIKRRRGRHSARDVELDSDATLLSNDTESHDNNDGSESHMLIGNGEKPNAGARKRSCLSGFRWTMLIPSFSLVLKTALFAFCLTTSLVRPEEPYDHMSVTLPMHFLDIFRPEPDHCSEQRRIMKNTWPYPELLDNKNWEDPNGDYKGWAPGSKLADSYRQRRPDWLPDEPPRGFLRWDPRRFDKNVPNSHGATEEAWKDTCLGLQLKDPFYNPVDDPMKITNLDTEILQPLKSALDDGSVKIKNVVFVLMESLRQELFPIKQDSPIHQTILQANPEADRAKVNELLSRLTPNHQRIAGVDGNFRDAEGNAYTTEEQVWQDKAKDGFGGVNVVGGYSMASLSTKSFGSTHCGSWPMAVEKFDEADTDAYQPCITQILDLWNQNKANSSSEDFREWPWYPALMEAEVEKYDRQEIFDQKLGFKHIVCRKEIQDDWRFNKSDPLYKEVNYFGLPEPALKPHIREYITNATANNQRIWMSHFTSTTHHPWGTPEWFDNEEYMPTSGGNQWHSDFNKYLNTIRFHDSWLAELLDLFDELNISNETLVVFAGDHGQAFKEDYHKTGTYDIGHVSAFRVPIHFRHPNLPRIQYEANVTSISILPTILDLLINSGSLNKDDKHIASDLVQDYEGQSLIRPYKKSHNGRRAWNFHVINLGAGIMAVSSADTPFRLSLPVKKTFEYTFTNTEVDPEEHDPTTAWTPEQLANAVKAKHGDEAAQWATEAVEVANWHLLERERLWRWHLLKT